MLNELTNKIISTCKNKQELSTEFEKLVHGSLLNFVKFICGDSLSGIDLVKDGTLFLYQLPNYIAFSNMKNFLCKLYSSLTTEEIIKLSNKFTDDNKNKTEFVKKQIILITKIDEDKKIDYIANLTRACLMNFIDRNVYFKLAYIIIQVTVEEIEYLNKNIDKPITLNMYTFALKQLGLIEQITLAQDGHSQAEYAYTPYAKALNQFALKYSSDNFKYDNNIPLTLDNLMDYYGKLNQLGFGNNLVLDAGTFGDYKNESN